MNPLHELGELLVPISDKDVPVLLETFQAHLCSTIGAAASILYIADATDAELYAFEVGSGLAGPPTPTRFRKGEGFLGQVVKEKRILYERFPSDVWGEPATSALIEVPEINIYAVPLIYQEQVEGVWCIAADKDLEPLLKTTDWQELQYKWAAYIHSLRSRRYIQSLLEQSQVQNQELITREEELRQNLEELAVTQEEMRRAQQLLAQQSERQTFIIDLFTLMAAADQGNFRSLSRIFLAQTVQYFHAEMGVALLRNDSEWNLLFKWSGKKDAPESLSDWHIPSIISEAFEHKRQPACYFAAEVGLEADNRYWLLLPYYTVKGLAGLIGLAFSEPFPIETEGHNDLMHIPIAYFSAYERVQKSITATQATLQLIAEASEAQTSTVPIEAPLETLPWLSEIPLVQRETYIAALREGMKQQRPFWVPPTEVARKEIIFITDKLLYRLKWA